MDRICRLCQLPREDKKRLLCDICMHGIELGSKEISEGKCSEARDLFDSIEEEKAIESV